MGIWASTGIAQSLVDSAPTLKGSSQGHVIRIFQISTHRQSGCELGNRDLHGPKQPRKIGCGRLTLEIWVSGKNDFLDSGVSQTLHQILDAKLIWAHAGNRRNCSTQHVIEAAELAGALDG
jgi:hypothetical protein